MNSVIEAQREFEEQRLKIRLLELRNIKILARYKRGGLVYRAMKMSGNPVLDVINPQDILNSPFMALTSDGPYDNDVVIDVCKAEIRKHSRTHPFFDNPLEKFLKEKV